MQVRVNHLRLANIGESVVTPDIPYYKMQLWFPWWFVPYISYYPKWYFEGLVFIFRTVKRASWRRVSYPQKHLSAHENVKLQLLCNILKKRNNLSIWIHTLNSQPQFRCHIVSVATILVYNIPREVDYFLEPAIETWRWCLTTECWWKVIRISVQLRQEKVRITLIMVHPRT